MGLPFVPLGRIGSFRRLAPEGPAGSLAPLRGKGQASLWPSLGRKLSAFRPSAQRARGGPEGHTQGRRREGPARGPRRLTSSKAPQRGPEPTGGTLRAECKEPSSRYITRV